MLTPDVCGTQNKYHILDYSFSLTSLIQIQNSWQRGQCRQKDSLLNRKPTKSINMLKKGYCCYFHYSI